MKIALVVKASEGTQARNRRNMGYWSYRVPEFKWQHFAWGSGPRYATELNEFDLIFQEDAGPTQLKGRKKTLVYLAIDSTLSEDHLKARLERAKGADLILLDHDDVERFAHLGKPIRRLNYCVNDRLFKPTEHKTVDVSFHCGSNEQRGKVKELLQDYCNKANLSFTTGPLDVVSYAYAMARSRIVVNWPRVPENRPHRVFDTMACNSCLVTGPLPYVPHDERIAGRDYVQINQPEDLPEIIWALLANDKWAEIAQSGYDLIQKHHTWSIRAGQLWEILKGEFNLG